MTMIQRLNRERGLRSFCGHARPEVAAYAAGVVTAAGRAIVSDRFNTLSRTRGPEGRAVGKAVRADAGSASRPIAFSSWRWRGRAALARNKFVRADHLGIFIGVAALIAMVGFGKARTRPSSSRSRASAPPAHGHAWR